MIVGPKIKFGDASALFASIPLGNRGPENSWTQQLSVSPLLPDFLPAFPQGEEAESAEQALDRVDISWNSAAAAASASRSKQKFTCGFEEQLYILPI